jgi:hypothetical protein
MFFSCLKYEVRALWSQRWGFIKIFWIGLCFSFMLPFIFSPLMTENKTFIKGLMGLIMVFQIMLWGRYPFNREDLNHILDLLNVRNRDSFSWIMTLFFLHGAIMFFLIGFQFIFISIFLFTDFHLNDCINLLCCIPSLMSVLFFIESICLGLSSPFLSYLMVLPLWIPYFIFLGQDISIKWIWGYNFFTLPLCLLLTYGAFKNKRSA